MDQVQETILEAVLVQELRGHVQRLAQMGTGSIFFTHHNIHSQVING
jgi:hypothetical protein